jgi:hypothetical protein
VDLAEVLVATDLIRQLRGVAVAKEAVAEIMVAVAVQVTFTPHLLWAHRMAALEAQYV